MLPLNDTFRNCAIATRPAVHTHRPTSAFGDERMPGSPFENPIRVIWSGADPDRVLSKAECALLRAAYFATFSDEY